MVAGPEQGIQALHRFQRALSRKTFGASVLIAAVLFVLGYKAVARGLLLGCLFSVLNFVVMAHALPRQIGLSRRRATGFALVSIVLRLGLLAIPLLIAMKSDLFHWIAVVVGLFSVPIAIFIDQVVVQRFYPRRVHP